MLIAPQGVSVQNVDAVRGAYGRFCQNASTDPVPVVGVGGRATESGRGPTRLPSGTKLRIPAHQAGEEENMATTGVQQATLTVWKFPTATGAAEAVKTVKPCSRSGS
jgi:hypothetical protein